MWKFNVAAAAAVFALSAMVSGQTHAPADTNAASPSSVPPSTAPAPPAAGLSGGSVDPLIPRTDTGLDKVANDGVSTKTVPAAPCGTVARETDGTTTCVGIPGPAGSINEQSGTAHREK